MQMPISAQQWRVAVGQVNASKSLPTLYKQPAQEEGSINWHILLLSLCSTGSHTVTEWWWNRTDERVQCNQLKCILSESMLLHIPNHPIIPSSSSLVRMQPM